MQHITIDGVLYRVRIAYPSMSRSFSIVEGQNGGTAITARSIRDIKGTSYAYEMQVEPDPRYPEDYDAFYEVMSPQFGTDTVHSHMVELPYGAGTQKFEMMVLSGSDAYAGRRMGRNAWKSLKVQFQPITPQRTI